MSFALSALLGERRLARRAGTTAAVALACLWTMAGTAAHAASSVSIEVPRQGIQLSGKVAIQVSAPSRVSRVTF